MKGRDGLPGSNGTAGSDGAVVTIWQ